VHGVHVQELHHFAQQEERHEAAGTQQVLQEVRQSDAAQGNEIGGMSMNGWFSISGIKKETKRIRWPKWKEIGSNTGEVLLFTVFFAVYFVLCELLVTYFLKLIGIGA